MRVFLHYLAHRERPAAMVAAIASYLKPAPEEADEIIRTAKSMQASAASRS
jgi:hypothetical protein